MIRGSSSLGRNVLDWLEQLEKTSEPVQIEGTLKIVHSVSTYDVVRRGAGYDRIPVFQSI
jgi:hypothetical protein